MKMRYLLDTHTFLWMAAEPITTTDPAPIPYTIEDNDGNTSNEALLTVTYGVAPVATRTRTDRR